MKTTARLGAAIRSARDRHHLLTTASLRAEGLSHEQIRTLVTDGVIQRAARATYRLPGTRTPVQDAAVVVVRRPSAVLSCATGLFLHGFELRPPRDPHFVLPPTAGGSTAIGHLHRAPLDDLDRTTRSGLPVTTAARSLVDLASHVSADRLAELLDEGIGRRLIRIDDVLDAMARTERAPGRSGLGRLREAVRPWTASLQPESPAEAVAIRRMHDAGLPMPVTQFEVYDADGLVARLDFAWPERLVGREYDSDRHHGPRRIEHDEERRRRLEALGWRIRSVGRADLRPGEVAWLELLRTDLRTHRRRAS